MTADIETRAREIARHHTDNDGDDYADMFEFARELALAGLRAGMEMGEAAMATAIDRSTLVSRQTLADIEADACSARNGGWYMRIIPQTALALVATARKWEARLSALEPRTDEEGRTDG